MDTQRRARRKPISEEKRERDVFLLYGAAFRNMPHLHGLGSSSEACSLPADHVPRPSADSTLSALAQLATFRLAASRAIISLVDDKREYILAEATPHMSLRPEAPGDAPKALWLGSVSVPRTWGICEKILNIDLQAFPANALPALIVKDIRESTELSERPYFKATKVRFYAGAPLCSPSGAIVGSISILDEMPRPEGLSKEHQDSLRDIAESVMDYLHNYTIKDQYRRGERFTRGLISFSEGASALMPFEDDSQRDPQEAVKIGQPNPSSDSVTEETSTSFHQSISAPSVTWLKGGRQRPMKKLQESILPTDSRMMFARAANVMRASSDLYGVVILDASVAANRNHDSRSSQEHSTGTETPGDSYLTKTSSSDEGGTLNADTTHRSTSRSCQVLGSAISDQTAYNRPSTNPPYEVLLETDLTRMLHDYPSGKIITFDVEGSALSSTDEGASSDPSESPHDQSSKRKSRASRANRITTALSRMLPGARSVAFIPFWDYERARWFAGCICWSKSPHRLLSASVDLPYFKIFSHSVMRELSRLDALASTQAKTTFVASISHELRSPLHGILGTLEFIKDTPLDAFQTSMLNSLNACGQTLLDTINHVMDYAKRSEGKKNVSSRRLKSTNTVRLSSKPLKNRRSRAGAFNFCTVTEEVIEAVFSGSTYVPVRGSMIDIDSSTSDSGSESTVVPLRKTCHIVLDLAHDQDWVYCFPIGSWRRIVMNIFGNAIKYTEKGHIHVSLHANESSQATGAPATVTLTITDTGKGMSAQFLADRAFHPFNQENPFASGTGLGLSIVHQIIETNGGKIEVRSEPSVGTRMTVKLALTRPESPPAVPAQYAQMATFLERLKYRKVCILRQQSGPVSEVSNWSEPGEGVIRFTNALADTLDQHLKMDVVQTANWEDHDAEIVVVPELSFDYLAAIRRRRPEGGRAPITVFIAMDALEAATLRSDARVKAKESVVEIMTQPCGPYKLAYILNQCLDRFDQPDENVLHYSLDSNYFPLDTPTIERPGFFSTMGNIEGSKVYNADTEPTMAHRVFPKEIATNVPTRPALQVPQVLIVDDNPINRSLLVAFLKKRKYAYQEAKNGLDALTAYRREPSRFKIVLMDLSMPVMDGMTSTRAIRQYESENNIERCRIVALTGLASASARLEALSSGVDHFMTKPLNFRALDALLKKEEERNSMENRPRGLAGVDETADDGGIGDDEQKRDQDTLRESGNVELQPGVEKTEAEQNHTRVDPQQASGTAGSQEEAKEIVSQPKSDGAEPEPTSREPELQQHIDDVASQRAAQTTRGKLESGEDSIHQEVEKSDR
ncbi:hypothetical protein CC86DRAFT_311533 [Ophiobolus disseminans]|uniref:histidine kinase n=1 Tax=Ophiobolus disseminans TaxID=1469910 RepID=A0A6A7AK51_9PLEO|nr:hypothetical protein CC86DRAFT_311533 [Ophiobolus disseminans]